VQNVGTKNIFNPWMYEENEEGWEEEDKKNEEKEKK
jgi:hypothetical protein